MTAFSIGTEKEALLAQRLAALGVREADLEEIFVRSGGHGGQNVNKTSTCVMLVHRPTGLRVKCQPIPRPPSVARQDRSSAPKPRQCRARPP
jgi:hypothetical protein